jgi:hypothetical protein
MTDYRPLPPAPTAVPPSDVPTRAPRNGLGLAGVILGIVGILFGLIPITFWIAGTLGVIGLILALVGLARARRGEATNRKTSIAGIVTSGLALILAIIGVVIVFTAFNKLSNDLSSDKLATSTVGPSSSGASSAGATSDGAGNDSGAYNDMPIGRSITVSRTNGNVPFSLQVQVASLKKSRLPLSQFGDKPKGTFVGILVQYTCAKGTCSYNPYDFTVRNESGDEYSAVYPPFEPDLHSGDLRAGRKARGYMTFDLPKGAYVVEYRSSLFEQDSASWKFTV